MATRRRTAKRPKARPAAKKKTMRASRMGKGGSCSCCTC